MVSWLGLAPLIRYFPELPLRLNRVEIRLRLVLLKCVLVTILAGLPGVAIVNANPSPRGDDPGAETAWLEMEPGLDFARFDSHARAFSADGDLNVVRVDPVRWEVKVLTPGPATGELGLTLEKWCSTFGLAAVINAGMYQADHRTHVGFCQIDGRLANRSANDYLSAFAWDPLDEADPPFRIFDLDEVPLTDVAKRYGTVVQNLRLIKRDRENRWQPSGDRWTEAALGEDNLGRMLLIYCATPWSMYDFNEILLDLPLDLVAAQHLEGRNQAWMWVEAFPLTDQSVWRKRFESGPVLPNVIGVMGPAKDSVSEDTNGKR